MAQQAEFDFNENRPDAPRSPASPPAGSHTGPEGEIETERSGVSAEEEAEEAPAVSEPAVSAPAVSAPAVSEPAVSEPAWSALFAAVDAVQKVAPWKKLYEADWFGLQDPVSGKTQVGSIVGHLGKVFGVHLYLQPEGVAFWNETVRHGGEPDIKTLQFRNRMLEIEFTSKGRLQPEDWAVRERLRLRTPPNKGRPFACFRAIHPACLPWFLNEEEARLLRLAAYAAIAHYRSFAFNPDEESYPMGESMPIIPTFSLREDGDPASEESWIRTECEMPLADPAEPWDLDEETRAQMKKLGLARGETWQIDTFFWPEPVGDGERPYFPRMGLIVSGGDSRIFGYDTKAAGFPIVRQVARLLADTSKTRNALAAVIEVRSPEVFEAVASLVADLGITIKRRLHLEAWDFAVNMLQESLESVQSDPE